MTKRAWDGKTYDRIGTPQAEWGKAVLDRMQLRGDETVVDAGCGSGRVTELLLERLPEGHVKLVMDPALTQGLLRLLNQGLKASSWLAPPPQQLLGGPTADIPVKTEQDVVEAAEAPAKPRYLN